MNITITTWTSTRYPNSTCSQSPTQLKSHISRRSTPHHPQKGRHLFSTLNSPKPKDLLSITRHLVHARLCRKSVDIPPNCRYDDLFQQKVLSPGSRIIHGGRRNEGLAKSKMSRTEVVPGEGQLPVGWKISTNRSRRRKGIECRILLAGAEGYGEKNPMWEKRGPGYRIFEIGSVSCSIEPPGILEQSISCEWIPDDAANRFYHSICAAASGKLSVYIDLHRSS